MRIHKSYPILFGNTKEYNGFWLESRTVCEGLLVIPKIYNFQKDNELTEKYNDLTEFEVFEINY